MDFTPFRVGLGIAFAVSAGFYLSTSVGKPPEWVPGSFRRFSSRIAWSRDRVRLYALVVGLFGVGVAICYGFIAR